MAKARKPTVTPRWDWYLREWLALYGKKQADLEKELEWNKGTASHVFNSKQPYKREMVNQVAEWLQLEPFELLMHPSDAMQVRKLRARELELVSIRREPLDSRNSQTLEEVKRAGSVS